MNTELQELRAFVESIDDDAIELTLYTDEINYLKCINGALIKHGLAVKEDSREMPIVHQEYYSKTKHYQRAGKENSYRYGFCEDITNTCITLSDYPYQATVLKANSPSNTKLAS
jgi:hypothetical protein